MTVRKATTFAFLLLSTVMLQPAISQPAQVDFRQAANNDRPNPMGDVHWVQSILQNQNSTYYEGMSIPQRVVLTRIPITRGNVHSLTFSHKATKGGKHAYDFMTSYSQALTTANAIVGPTVLQNLNPCGDGIGPPNSMGGTCLAIRAGTFSVSVPLPDAMGTVLSHDIEASITNFEARFGNRTIQLYGEEAISNPSVTFDGYTSGIEVAAQYTITWTSASRSILIEMAGHLAMGNDVRGAGKGIGYGSGFGAGSISGGSYHVKLDRLDGNALGSQDNQIMGATVLTSIECNTTGPDPVCAGTQNTYSYGGTAAGLTYSWSLLNNTSAASIVGPFTGESVVVDAGSGPGEYTLSVVVRDGIQTVNCTYPVRVNGFHVTAASQPLLCRGGMAPVNVSATGGAAPYTGTGRFFRHAGTHTFTVTDARGCSRSSTVTIVEPASALAVSVNAPPILCNGGTSAVVVSATGGTPPYSGTGSYNRTAGTYTFNVTDANGCMATSAPVTISGPAAALAVSASAAAVLCNGGSTNVTVGATGGTPPYSGTGTYSRTAGTYTFTVTDANGCTATSTAITITEPSAALAVSVNAPSILCNGGSSAVVVDATGGTAPYSGTGTFNRTAGTYTFTVTDANGCTATSAAVTITEPSSALAVSASATAILCSGGSATVTVSATGGTPPYTGTGTFNRSAGTYSFVVTDANGCTASSPSITLIEPSAIVVSVVATPISCNGGNSTVTVSATGGTPPYSGTGTFSYGAGTYSFTVTDANGCSGSSAATTLTDPPLLAVSVQAPPIQCYGGTSSVVVSAVGGTPPYNGTGTFSHTAGTYTFSVTDANNCTASSGSVTITQPTAALAVSAQATTILCNGQNSTVTVTASGGTPPYSGTGTFSRSAGTHTFTVTDANGCSASSSSLLITEPAALAVGATATPILCNGGSSTVTVTATGGTPPYSGDGTFTLGAGSYTFTVTDANGCSVTTSATTLTEPAQLVINVNAPSVLCYGGSSTVTVTATGGTSPYTGTGTFTVGPGSYTYTVTDANGCSTTSQTITITQPASALAASATATSILCNGDNATVTVIATGGTAPYTGVGTFSRGAGTHSFNVTDANGCTATTTAITITEPPALAIGVNATPILCNGGNSTVTVTASGGTPPYSGEGTFTLGAGSYSFTVTDGNGCSATSSATTLTEPALLTVDVQAPPILCSGGTSIVTVTATGGTAPYTGTGTFTLGPGAYIFTVTDDNGCATLSSVITLTDPPALTASASATPILCHGDNSTVTVTASGGTPPYTGTGTFTYGAGSYTFTVADANGCTASTSVNITSPPLLTVTANAPPVVCGRDSSTITVNASGGVSPYTGTGTFRRGLGTYTFTVMDANGCTAATQVTVTGPQPLFAAANATPILCHGDLSTVTVTAWGGTAPYSGVGTFSSGAGSYAFVVTDANGCMDTVFVTIVEPPALVVTVVADPIVCNGDETTITVSATGGTPPYNGTGTFSRGAGTYTFVVTDAHGCGDSVSIAIQDPPVLNIALSATTILCYGDNATVTVTASGGTPLYSGTGLFQRGVGTHIFSVTDSRGCTANASITITGPPELVAQANAPVVLCGRDQGIITISATGGTPPYYGTGTYPRTPGTYTFIVTDANGCADTVQATVTGPPPVYATAGSTPILCHGGTSVVTINAWGGTPPYSGVGTFTYVAGTYTFIVTDANQCPDTVTITILEPPPLVVTCTLSDCENGVRHVSAIVSGGTPPYSYYWAPFGTQAPSFDIPCSWYGTISLRVRDSHWDQNDPNNSACEATCDIQVFAKEARGGAASTERATNDYALYENYPNPFNPSTTIRYFVPKASRVRLEIVNTLGRTISTLVDAEVPGGIHEATWNAVADHGTKVPSGSYIYRIHARSVDGEREFVQERLMLLLK